MPVTGDDNQYCTDFGKAVKILTGGYLDSDLPELNSFGPQPPPGPGVQDIIIMSTLAGRVDQALGLLHELYRETKKHSQNSDSALRLWLLSEQSVSFLLPIGQSTVRGLDPSLGLFTRNVCFLPIYGPASITTTGLEWDVQEWETRMGGMVSTSNHVTEGEILVVVKGEMVLFTVEMAKTERDVLFV